MILINVTRTVNKSLPPIKAAQGAIIEMEQPIKLDYLHSEIDRHFGKKIATDLTRALETIEDLQVRFRLRNYRNSLRG